MTAKKWKTQYVKDLEYIFQEAFKNKNFSTALKAKELLAKELAKEGEVTGNKLTLKGLSLKEIQKLIADLPKKRAKKKA